MPDGIFSAALIYATDHNVAQTTMLVRWEDPVGDFPAFYAARETYVNDVAGTIMNVMWMGARHWLTRYRHVTGQFAGAGFENGSGLTGGMETVAPYYVAMKFRRLRGDPPEPGRSWAYIPFIGADWLGGPTIDVDSPRVQDARGALLHPRLIDGISFQPYVANETAGEWVAVTDVEPSPWLGFQRRRNIGRAYYPNGPVPIP